MEMEYEKLFKCPICQKKEAIEKPTMGLRIGGTRLFLCTNKACGKISDEYEIKEIIKEEGGES